MTRSQLDRNSSIMKQSANPQALFLPATIFFSVRVLLQSGYFYFGQSLDEMKGTRRMVQNYKITDMNSCRDYDIFNRKAMPGIVLEV